MHAEDEQKQVTHIKWKISSLLSFIFHLFSADLKRKCKQKEWKKEGKDPQTVHKLIVSSFKYRIESIKYENVMVQQLYLQAINSFLFHFFLPFMHCSVLLIILIFSIEECMRE